MKADELREYLSRNPVERGIFSYNELDEVILTVYNMIDWSVRDQCDTIEVRDEQVVWYIGRKLYDQMSTPFSFKPTFEKIRKRDKVIGSHLILSAETKSKAVYEVVVT
jgi:hypothetical protein